MNKTEAAARLERLLAILELQAWKLTRQIFSKEAAELRTALRLRRNENE